MITHYEILEDVAETVKLLKTFDSRHWDEDDIKALTDVAIHLESLYSWISAKVKVTAY